MALNIPYSIATNAKEFLVGISSDINKNNEFEIRQEVEKLGIFNLADKNLRALYDRYIPNIHIVDVHNFTNIIINELQIAVLPNSKEYIGIVNIVRKHVSSFHSKVLNPLSPNPIEKLNDISIKLFNQVDRIDTPARARSLGNRFSKQITSVFGTRSIIGVIDPYLGSSQDTYIFFSRSFNAIANSKVYRIDVTNNISTDISFYLERKDIAVGKITNFGHAAIKQGAEFYLNSPAFASALFGVASGRSGKFKSNQVQEAAIYFKTTSKITENFIEIKKEFSNTPNKYSVLLSLGITITIPENAKSNQLRGTQAEASAIRSLKISKEKELTYSGREKLKDNIIKIALRDLTKRITAGRSSRSIDDFIKEVVFSTLKGTTLSGEKSKKRTSNKSSTKVLESTISPTILKNPKLPNKITPLRSQTGKFISPVSIMNLLNSRLAQQIQNNMGKGNAKAVLNYRTGRFAESAEVVNVSNRDSAVTAFYSYMKNPYATFAPGGAQDSPASRDPNKLIQASIRQLATGIITNRLRVVPV